MPDSTKAARWLIQTVLGYTALITVSLWCPVGIHRILMRRRDWWHWSASYALLAAGAMVWMSTGRNAAVIVTVLGGGAWWGSLLVRDLLTMWAWHWPFSKPIFTWFDALNKRFGLLEKAGLFVIVTLGMRFLAHIS